MKEKAMRQIFTESKGQKADQEIITKYHLYSHNKHVNGARDHKQKQDENIKMQKEVSINLLHGPLTFIYYFYKFIVFQKKYD